jgi:hypothetical protein
MRKKDALIIALCLAIVTACAVYFAAPPGPRFYPLEGEWSLEVRAEVPSMGYYGHILWSLGTALLVGLIAALVLRPLSRAEAPAPLLSKTLAIFVALGLLISALGISAREYRKYRSHESGKLSKVEQTSQRAGDRPDS